MSTGINAYCRITDKDQYAIYHLNETDIKEGCEI